jgi:guanylate kinase
MSEAVEEMSHYTESDYLVVNNKFELALQELEAIVVSQRLRTANQTQSLRQLLTDLLN